MRIQFFSLASAALMLLAVFVPQSSSAGQGKSGDKHDQHAAHFQKCAEECGVCQRECDACSVHCARMVAKGKKEHLTTLQTCQDCATHCAAAAAIMARQGPFSDLICKACAEACARCGKECEKFSDDAHMKRCAEACRRCEKACREMLAHLPAGAKATGPK